MSKIRMGVALGMIAALAACSENTAAPVQQVQSTTTNISAGGATEALTTVDTIRFSITIEPWHQTSFYLGAGNSLVFPAHSLCDPYKSSYGIGEWDKPCVAATQSTTTNVKAWLDAHGHAHVDFDKHLRFVPSNDPSNWVVLTFADLQASLDPFFNILYCPNTSGACIDESKTDLTLLTVRNPITGKVTRRIKHFSGYNVAAGDGLSDDSDSMFNLSPDGARSLNVSTADLSLDDLVSVSAAHPDLNPTEVETMLSNIRFARRFSGYILASG